MATTAVLRRPALAAAAAYAVLALAFVSPGLVPGHTLSAADFLWSAAPWTAAAPADVRPLGSNYELADAVEVFEPFFQYSRARLPSAPLWNPYIGGGRPFAANAQSALFSPFTWPALVLPFWWSLAVVAALKLWCCAFGGFLLGRALGMSAPAAGLTGLVMGFGLWFVTWLAWPLASVWAFLPWLLLLVDMVVRRPGPAPVAGLAVVVALQFFGGHPESSFHVLAAASLFALIRPGWLRAVPRLVGGLLLGTALAAVAVLPFVELLAHSVDLATRGDREAVTVAPKYLLGLALPEYWGRPTGVVSESFINSRAYYAGALPLLLAVVAVLRPTRERIAVAAAGAVAVLVATGVEPVFSLVGLLPGFSQSHNTRLGIVALAALALLAGWGFDDVRARRPSPRVLAVLGAVVALPLLVVALRGSGEPGPALAAAWGFAEPAVETLPLAAALVWLPFALAALALLRWPGRHFVLLALALTAADLFRAGVGQNPAIPVAHARQPATGAIRHLQAQPGRFAGVAEAAVVQPLPPDVAMRYGLRDARSYDLPVERRYATLWARAVAPPDPFGLLPAGAIATATPEARRALALLGVSHLLTPPGDVLPLTPTYEGDDARVYANPGALPPALLVGRQRVVDGEDAALAAVTEPGFDPAATVVVERRLPLAGGRGRAVVRRSEPERIVVATDATAAAVLVMPDVHFPGWRATLDGRDVPLEQVDYLLRGVVVPAGTHQVELRYRPVSWTAGWIVSVLAALAVVALWKSPRRWPAR